MVFIYTRTYTSAVTAQATKQVVCEKCQCQYAYQMVRRGVGKSSSAYGIGNNSAKNAAQRSAQKKLQKRLTRGSDPVPCPDCGWIQAHMVADLRRRAHRWLFWLGVIVFSLLLASAVLAVPGASNGFARAISRDELLIIGGMAGAAVLFLCGALGARRLWSCTINPNRRYPERPVPVPGLPIAVKHGSPPQLPSAGESGRVVHAGSNFPTAPAPSGAPSLSYEVRSPRLEPGNWITVQLLNLRHPTLCCSCLGPPQKLQHYPCGTLAKVPIPMCEACLRRYRTRGNWTKVAGAVAGAAIGASVAMGSGASAAAHIGIIALVGCIAGLIAGAVVAARLARPVSFSRFSPELNTVRLRFRNPAYVNALLENGRVV